MILLRPKILALALFGLAACGCREKPSSPLEQAVPVKPKEAAAQIDQAFVQAPSEIQSYAKAASEALQRADYEGAVQSLQLIKEQGSLTVEQGMAVHNSMISLEAKLIAAMGAGDANAQRAYEQLKKARKN